MGFRSFGEFAQTVQNHYRGNVTDHVTRLRNAATTFGNEGVGADGGFLIPPSFSANIWQKVNGIENLLTRCTPLTTDGNSLTIPKDETTPWDTTKGVQVYWEGEGAADPAVQGPVRNGAAAPLQADGAGADQRGNDAGRLGPGVLAARQGAAEDGLEDQHRDHRRHRRRSAARHHPGLWRGRRVGHPGLEGDLAAGRYGLVANINKMWGRMYAGWRRNAVWLINQDVEPQLEGMAFRQRHHADRRVVDAGLSAAGRPQLALRAPEGPPGVPIEACSALGNLGDIILCDLSQYWALTKAGGAIQTDTSIHLYFDQALTAFRFIFRVNGQPAWSAPIARQNGSNTLSWAVALQAR
jgi:hypothetical protein